MDSSLNSGVCLFYVEGEPDVYDSEPIILVDFTRNLAVADCEENRLLDGKGSEKSELEFTSIQEKVSVGMNFRVGTNERITS